MRQNRKWKGVIRETAYGGGNRGKFTAMQVPTQCPIVPLVKQGLREGKAFEVEQGQKLTAARTTRRLDRAGGDRIV
jgi:hypothetical protein